MIAAGLVDRPALDEAIVFLTTPRVNGQPAHAGVGMGPTEIGAGEGNRTFMTSLEGRGEGDGRPGAMFLLTSPGRVLLNDRW